MISLASVKPQQIARLVVTIPQFKRDFQLDNNTGDDIHTTLARCSRYHIGLELVHRSDKIVGAENPVFGSDNFVKPMHQLKTNVISTEFEIFHIYNFYLGDQLPQ